jgi:hypothetical protein
VPINFYWQRALEARYPGFPSRAEIANLLRSWRSLFSFSALRALFSSAISSEGSPRMSDDVTALPLHREKEKEKEAQGRWAPRAQRSGLHSFVMKFLFDQTVAGAMNIVLFVVLINFLKGENLSKVWELVLVVRFDSPLFHTLLGDHPSMGIFEWCLLLFLGFSSHYDRPSEVSARSLDLDVHSHPCR